MSKKKKLSGTIDDFPLVYITTLDWVSNSEWVSIPKAKRLEPAECHSVGYLFNKSRKKIQTFGSYSSDEDGIEVGTIETIPRAWVLEIRNVLTGKTIK